jgi:hypothetical protein
VEPFRGEVAFLAAFVFPGVGRRHLGVGWTRKRTLEIFLRLARGLQAASAFASRRGSDGTLSFGG